MTYDDVLFTAVAALVFSWVVIAGLTWHCSAESKRLENAWRIITDERDDFARLKACHLKTRDKLRELQHGIDKLSQIKGSEDA